MGRGKKKGQKNDEEDPSLSSSILSDEPSTSRTQSLPVAPTTSAAPETSKAPDVPKAEEEDPEGLGLDIGGPRKRKPRKKKGPAAVAEATSTLSSASGVVQSMPAPGGPSLGLGRGQQHSQAMYAPGGLPPGYEFGQQPSQGFPTWGGPPAGRGRGQPHSQGMYAPTGLQPGHELGQPPSQGFPTWGGPPAGRGRGQQHSQVMGQPHSQVMGQPHSQVMGQPPIQGMPAPGVTSQGRGRGQPPYWLKPEGHPDLPAPGRSAMGAQFASTSSAAAPSPAVGGQPSTRPIKSQLTLAQYKIPQAVRRPSIQARKIIVLTNYLPMTIQALKIYRYDVSFKPDRPKKMIGQVFYKVKAAHYKNSILAFDQMKNCYALQRLPGVPETDRFTTEAELLDSNGKTIKFEVSFKFTGIVDLGRIKEYMNAGGSSLSPPTDAIQCIDVILRQGTLESYVKAGKQFFKRPNRPIDLGDGLEMWTGLFQSAIFTSTSFVNIDVAHKGFPRHQSMIDALTRDFRLDTNQPLEHQRNSFRAVENFNQFIKGLRVTAVIGGDTSAKGQKREFFCNGVVDPPNRLFFTMKHPDGQTQKMSVADYFLKEKKYKLRFPNLNCMWVGPRSKNLYFPMELLEIVYGQAMKKQLNDMQLSKMVREAATPPNIRKQKIDDVKRDMNYSNNKFFKQFGLEISDKFLQVEAKVLPAPKLMIGGGKTMEPRRGVWQANSLLQPEILSSWGFIAIEADPTQSNFNAIIDMIMRVGTQMGMRVAAPKCTHFNVRINELLNILFTALDKEIKFLFIIVSRRGRDYYHKVKRLAELEVGILTQCIKEDTASRRMNEATVRNIILKVNAKMMGINQALDGRSMPPCLKGHVMVVGADVTHPSPDQTSIPSIAAVTASIDPKCFIYNIELSVQTPKKEIIIEFEDMMVEHMQVYRQQQKVLPKKIYIFRDGVSEGQFEEVMNSELTAVYRAYQRLTGSPEKPEVLFLLVQKRHHTRFFSGADNPQNVEPGTVVDDKIVHAKELDFYLVSHQAIKGTARPTRYHAVCNDGGIPLDEVEQLTYYLCHLYSRCMRAVSYPTPTYYAHLACLRAKSLTHGDTFNNEELERKPKRLHVLKKMLDFSRMFFV